MPDFHFGPLPDVLFHGTVDRASLQGPCVPASKSGWWSRIPWRTFDSDFEQARMAYANVVWSGLGLAVPGRPLAPEWAKRIRSFDQLAERIGLLFVTDDPDRARHLYGPSLEIDMTHPSILDAVEDPNVGTHNAWILVLKAGEPLPLLHREPAVRPGHVRLYRGETDMPGKAASVPDWIAEQDAFKGTMAATGRWFAAERRLAEYYNRTFGDGTGRISYVDVPRRKAEACLAARNPEAKAFSARGREHEEYFLPPELAAARKPLPRTPPRSAPVPDECAGRRP
jgi:hypothetical protein